MKYTPAEIRAAVEEFERFPSHFAADQLANLARTALTEQSDEIERLKEVMKAYRGPLK